MNFMHGLAVKSKQPVEGPSKSASSPLHGKIEPTHNDSLSTGQPAQSVAHSAHIVDGNSDDEIKYETNIKSMVPDDVLEGDAEDDTDDNETVSESDDDEALVSRSTSRSADASSRQLFQPPEETDYGDETDDDSVVSASSSSESSPVADAEPVVPLPSAIIQFEQDYPEQILDMANPGRRYHTWFGTLYSAATAV